MVTWCQSIMMVITDHPRSQPVAPCSLRAIARQNGKNSRSQFTSLIGTGGGLSASSTSIKRRVIVHRVKPVNQAIRLRGLRVTTYTPNHNAMAIVKKLEIKVKEKSTTLPFNNKHMVYCDDNKQICQ